jgi:hypothetical protein
VLGLESVKDAEGKIIHEAPLADWGNLRQRALDIAIREINKKTDLNIALESLERTKDRRVIALVFTIKAKTVPNANNIIPPTFGTAANAPGAHLKERCRARFPQ